MIQSKALEANIADYHVDVAIDEKYSVLQGVMSKYYGIRVGRKCNVHHECHHLVVT